MAGRIWRHARHNVVAYVALTLALSGGVAWALERNSVNSKHIVNGAVRPPDLNDKARTLWALVSDDGTILQQSGGISVDGENQGSYVLDFGRRIAKRGLMATVSYEGAPDIATVHVSHCGDDNQALKAGCDFLEAGADDSGRHAYVFTQVTSGSGGDAAAFWVAALPR